MAQRIIVPALVMLLSHAASADAQVLRAQLVAQGLSQPIAFVQDPSQPNVQFIVEQTGLIRILVNGMLGGTFLDLTTEILLGGERGLLGLAFPPDYPTSRRFYVNFTRDPDGHTVVARFLRDENNPLLADESSRLDLKWPDGMGGTIDHIVQPYPNHNGGHLAFGSDGYLYIGLGDGGSGGDPEHRAQMPGTLLGKMLRINVNVDVSDPEGYDVPGTNPFLADPNVLPEIWSFGLRNPWRYSFDDVMLGGTGALILGDVGQGMWEEVNYEPALAGGRNYGWRLREGAHPYDGSEPPYFTPLRDPIWEYDHTTGSVVTGGVVYRGSNLGAGFFGRYFFTDFGFSRVWSVGLTIDGSGEATAHSLIEHTSTLGLGAQNVSHVGVDANGEIYLVSYSGRVYRLYLEFVTNGNFSSGTTGWLTFATPDSTYIQGSVVGGVFEFYRVPPPPGTSNQAVIFQQTGLSGGALTRFEARFDLGNSSTVRKRVSVLLGDANFNDVVVCTFWLAPGAPLRTYRMFAHTIEAWTDATISFYAATPGSDGGAYRLDNVSLRPDFGGAADRTECIDPTAPAPPGGPDGPELVSNGGFSAALPPWLTFGELVFQLNAGVFEFYRSGALSDPAGVVFQELATAFDGGTILSATFELGNSSGVRKRVTVLLHDADFTDLTACTFWLAPGQPLSTYVMRGFSTKAWANATVSIYAATIGSDQWIRLDNVSVRQTPGQVIFGTQCIEPVSPFRVAPRPDIQ
jgi:glucose/arabinose dehydrogenase